ncbi:hypothetical protein BpHYR1_013001 [Brachionus plicatilis]|uniref:Uncharacterized protein n=1 Tax=Brachionus plicatilis TaxID=10195 RepID=A0A3M7QGY0_BRAPC|nr:hypothetical protein BpHYR1_013001 [Brachionus plicatilis]
MPPKVATAEPYHKRRRTEPTTEPNQPNRTSRTEPTTEPNQPNRIFNKNLFAYFFRRWYGSVRLVRFGCWFGCWFGGRDLRGHVVFEIPTV